MFVCMAFGILDSNLRKFYASNAKLHYIVINMLINIRMALSSGLVGILFKHKDISAILLNLLTFNWRNA